MTALVHLAVLPAPTQTTPTGGVSVSVAYGALLPVFIVLGAACVTDRGTSASATTKVVARGRSHVFGVANIECF